MAYLNDVWALELNNPLPPFGTSTNNRYKILLTNKNPYSYSLRSESIVSKVDVLRGRSLCHIKDVPVELWTNWDSSWVKYSDATTDRYGSCYIETPTSGIIGTITNCLGIAKVTINGETYVSNVMRYNFYS